MELQAAASGLRGAGENGIEGAGGDGEGADGEYQRKKGLMMTKRIGMVVVLLGFFLGCKDENQTVTTPDDNSLEIEIQPQEQKSRLEALRAEVQELDGRKEYKLAYNVIKDEIGRYFTYDSMEFAFSYARQHYRLLKNNCTQDSLSNFVEPSIINIRNKKELDDSELYQYYRKKKKSNGGEIGFWDIMITGAGLGFNSVSLDLPMKIREATFIAKEEAKHQQFSLPDKDRCEDVLQQYDILRDAIKSYIVIVEKIYPVGASQDEKTRYYAIKEKIEKLKMELLSARCDFISYIIISPSLAEVKKQMFIAQGSWMGLIRKDKRILEEEVVSNLARLFHKEWLYETDEPVRRQFFDVMKELKNMTGKAEFEEYKTLATLLNSYDPSKHRGMMAWWE